jgi:hypothetical protein
MHGAPRAAAATTAAAVADTNQVRGKGSLVRSTQCTHRVQQQAKEQEQQVQTRCTAVAGAAVKHIAECTCRKPPAILRESSYMWVQSPSQMVRATPK